MDNVNLTDHFLIAMPTLEDPISQRPRLRLRT
jgi:putative AlgH/UPF0301 family transcriptional regulator